MAKLTRTTISRRTVENLSVEKDTVYWDRELPGFGVRAYATRQQGVRGADTLEGQIHASDHRAPRGDHTRGGPPSCGADHQPHQVGPARGRDGIRTEGTHGGGVGRAVSHRARGRTPEGQHGEMVRADINKYILPEFGKLAIEAVGHERIAAYHSNLHRVPSMANRMVETLSAMFSMAETWGLLPQGANPCPRVVRYKPRRKERFLTEAEFERLGRGLERNGGRGRHPAPRSRCDSIADAHGVPVQRDTQAALG